MCFPRKASLGRYNANRTQWKRAYREARCKIGDGCSPNHLLSGIEWKAQLIVADERERIDPLTIPVLNRLAAQKIIEEILSQL